MKALTEGGEGKTPEPTSWPEGRKVRKLLRVGLRSAMTSEHNKVSARFLLLDFQTRLPNVTKLHVNGAVLLLVYHRPCFLSNGLPNSPFDERAHQRQGFHSHCLRPSRLQRQSTTGWIIFPLRIAPTFLGKIH